MQSELGLHDFRFFVSWLVGTKWSWLVDYSRLSKVKICLKFKVIFSFWNVVMIEQVRMKNIYFYVYQSLFINKTHEKNANDLQSTSIGEHFLLSFSECFFKSHFFQIESHQVTGKSRSRDYCQ